MNFHRIDTTTIDVTTGKEEDGPEEVRAAHLPLTSSARSSAEAGLDGHHHQGEHERVQQRPPEHGVA